jgi:hypothetical protein
MAVVALQAVAREGFDVTRHPASFLSIGEWGWIQVTNFLVTGALFVAGALGMRRVMREGRGRTWGPLLITFLGVGMIAAGVFVSDPAFGFPPGTPDAMPDELTTHGLLHGVAAGIGFLSLIAACFVFGRRFASAGEQTWSRASTGVGIIFLIAAIAGSASPGSRPGNVALGVSLILALAWTSVLAGKLRDEYAQHGSDV